MKNFGTTPGAASKAILALALLFQGVMLPASAFAASSDSIKAIRKGLPLKAINAVVLSYARSIGCNEYVDPKLVVEIPNDIAIPSDRPGKRYLATYSVDVGCSGGSAMSTTSFAVVRQGNFPTGFFIDPQLSRPEATIGFPNDITGLGVRNGEIVFTAKDFDFAKDALCCPSVVVSGKVVLKIGYPPTDSELQPQSFWRREPEQSR